MADLPERFWANLLAYIQEGTVIPILGSDLLTVRDGDREMPLDRRIAEWLVDEFQLPGGDLPAGFGLNDVVSLHMRRHGGRDELYPAIDEFLRQNRLESPLALQELAGISGFPLFVSLTFDSLLEQALDARRAPVASVVHTPRALGALPGPGAALPSPLVFHLLGKACPSPEYVICDEDLLEHVYALQDRARQPRNLFGRLRSHHLLLLGCHYDDWLARFFLRTARGLELSQRRRRLDVLVGDHLAEETGLVLFLESYCTDSHRFEGTAGQFVAELARRWAAAHPEPGAGAAPVAPAPAGEVVPDGAIFVSYATEDHDAAHRLVDILRAAKLEVWFDRDILRAGEAWKRNIRAAIGGCALFLPLLSRASLSEENRRNRFFWREWREADNLAQGMAPGEVFLVPVTIDGSPLDHPDLPGSFPEAQGLRATGGALTPGQVEQLVEQVHAFHRRRKGVA